MHNDVDCTMKFDYPFSYCILNQSSVPENRLEQYTIQKNLNLIQSIVIACRNSQNTVRGIKRNKTSSANKYNKPNYLGRTDQINLTWLLDL